jgi:hypothetical protein
MEGIGTAETTRSSAESARTTVRYPTCGATARVQARGEVKPMTPTDRDAGPERSHYWGGLDPDARLPLIMAAFLATVIFCTERSRTYCAVLHHVVVDGRVYVGGCTTADGYLAQVAVMGLAPLATAVAMLRRGLSLRRWIGLIALVALELAIIGHTVPGRALAHPHLLRADPSRGGTSLSLILAD